MTILLGNMPHTQQRKKEKNIQPVWCLFCGFVSAGGIYRVKVHNARVNPNGWKLKVTMHCFKKKVTMLEDHQVFANEVPIEESTDRLYRASTNRSH